MKEKIEIKCTECNIRKHNKTVEEFLAKFFQGE